jgi:hypothetical protein
MVHRGARWLRDEEARPVNRILDHTWTKVAYDPYLPCTGRGFLAASGAVSAEPGVTPRPAPRTPTAPLADRCVSRTRR